MGEAAQNHRSGGIYKALAEILEDLEHAIRACQRRKPLHDPTLLIEGHVDEIEKDNEGEQKVFSNCF